MVLGRVLAERSWGGSCPEAGALGMALAGEGAAIPIGPEGKASLTGLGSGFVQPGDGADVRRGVLVRDVAGCPGVLRRNNRDVRVPDAAHP